MLIIFTLWESQGNTKPELVSGLGLRGRVSVSKTYFSRVTISHFYEVLAAVRILISLHIII